jgi:tetratricopeptide (TPR) repeat protein
MNIPFKNIFVFIFFALVISVVYSNSLHNGFMFDDYNIVLKDTKIHNLKFILYQFIPDMNRSLNLEQAGETSYYRPLYHIAPMLCYLIFGPENPFPYHLVNLILFILVVFLLYILFMVLFGNELRALLAALLYAIHPINGLFINYITATVYNIQMIAMLLTLILFVKYGHAQKNIWYWIVSFSLMLISLFCHETSLALPIYLFLTAVCLQKKSLSNAVKQVWPFFIFAALFFIFRMNHASLKASILDNVFLFDMNIFQYTATVAKLLSWYLKKLFFPVDIVFMWATPVIKKNVWSWNVLLISAIGLLWVAQKLKHRFSDVAWGIGLFSVGFSLVFFACLFQPFLGLMIEPHWLFFPSIGLFWMVSGVFINNKRRNLAKVLLVICVIPGLIFATRSMNRLWGNEKAYCRVWLKEVPDIKYAYFYLGHSYMNEKNYEEAKSNYLKSLSSMYQDWQVYTNLGLIEAEEGHHEQSIEYYKKALSIFPKSAVILNNLGAAYLNKGEIDTAEGYFQKAVSYNRFSLEPRLNLARIYFQQQKYKEAEEQYHENLKIEPNHTGTLLEIISFYLKTSQKDKAFEWTLQCLERAQDVMLLTGIGGLLEQYQEPKMAVIFFNQAVKKFPGKVEGYSELGKFLGNHGYFPQAIEVWEEGLRVDPQNKEIKENLAQIRSVQKD